MTPPAPKPPEQDQHSDAIDAEGTTRSTVSTPETDGARVSEAGHGYVGRTMDDRLKANPRVRGDGEADAADGDAAP